VKIDSKTAYIWRSLDPEFREAWDYAQEDATDVVEDSLYRQATSDKCFLATIAWLKARRPIYRDKLTVDVSAIQREIEQRVDELAMIDDRHANSPSLPPSKNTLTELLTSGQLQLGPLDPGTDTE
jgi:hypothetical protein